MIFISDESGDTGVPHSINASKLYTISYALVINKNPDSLKHLISSASSASKEALGTGLSEWKKLGKDNKNNPQKLHKFIQNFYTKMNENGELVLFGFYIVDKQEIEQNDGDSNNKKRIKDAADQGYYFILKRVLACMKKIHYEKGLYPSNGEPALKWIIDNNSKEFISRQKKIAQDFEKNMNVKIEGPEFISKKEKHSHYKVNAIKIVDLLGGIASKIFESYAICNTYCNSLDCFREANCDNKMFKVWEEILKCAMNQQIYLEEKDNIIWRWKGIQYYPALSRSKHDRFFTEDGFFSTLS